MANKKPVISIIVIRPGKVIVHENKHFRELTAEDKADYLIMGFKKVEEIYQQSLKEIEESEVQNG